jgi:AraC family transcriptional regulator
MMSVHSHARSFIGSRCATHAAGAFAFDRWIASGRGDVQAHGHAEAHFMYVPSGDYRTDASGRRAGDGSHLVYNPPGTYHRDQLLGPGSFFTISIEKEEIESATDERLPAAPALIANAEAQAILRKLTRECANWEPDSALRGESLCLELLGAIAGVPSRERNRPVWLGAAIALLNNGMRELSVAAIARRVGVHPVHLARTFRAFFGCTPGDYVRERRCQRAAHLLSHTRRPIAEVALASGFADQSHFTRQFRRVIGVPPAEFRRLTAQ